MEILLRIATELLLASMALVNVKLTRWNLVWNINYPAILTLFPLAILHLLLGHSYCAWRKQKEIQCKGKVATRVLWTPLPFLGLQLLIVLPTRQIWFRMPPPMLHLITIVNNSLNSSPFHIYIYIYLDIYIFSVLWHLFWFLCYFRCSLGAGEWSVIV